MSRLIVPGTLSWVESPNDPPKDPKKVIYAYIEHENGAVTVARRGKRYGS